MKDWSRIPLQDIGMETRTNIDFQTRIGGFLRADLFEGLTAEIGGSWQKGNTHKKELRYVDAYAVRIAYNDPTSKKNLADHYLPYGSIVDETTDSDGRSHRASLTTKTK